MLVWWMCLLACGVATVLVRLGLSLVVCGSVRRPSASATLARAGMEAAAATLAFWAVGAPLLLGQPGGPIAIDTGLVASQSTESDKLATSEFYHWAVALIGGAVVGGAIAERGKRRVGVVAAAVLGGVVFPVVGRWVWFGWLHRMDFADVGGATAVHLPAAVFAAVAAAAVGPRADRFDGPGGEPPAGHSWPLVALGVGLTVIGWMPYLIGGLLAHPTDLNTIDGVRLLAVAALNVALAAAGGLAGGVGFSHFRRRQRGDRPAAFCGTVGLLGGLVAVSAGPVAMGGPGAVLVGVLAGVTVPAFAALLDRRVRLDDPAGLISVHGVGAVWGTLAAGLFAVNSSVGLRRPRLFAVQALGLTTVLAVSIAAAAVTIALLRVTGRLRVDADDERLGLDAVELGID